MARTYRKTATIKAEQFDGTKEMAEELGLFRYRGSWYLETLEGSLAVKKGYWIATGANGEHWPIADDVFKKTYAELPVIPKNVARLIKQDKEWNYNLGMVFDDAFHGWIWENGIGKWIITHSDTFARAWLDGYTVE